MSCNGHSFNRSQIYHKMYKSEHLELALRVVNTK